MGLIGFLVAGVRVGTSGAGGFLVALGIAGFLGQSLFQVHPLAFDLYVEITFHDVVYNLAVRELDKPEPS